MSKLMIRPEEELSAGRAWVDEVMDNLPNSTMKMLAVSCFFPNSRKLTKQFFMKYVNSCC
jgi:hypothetical protein